MNNIWFNIQDYISDKYLLYFFVGGHGIGKTYSSFKWAIDDYRINKKEAIWLRRYDVDLDDADKEVNKFIAQYADDEIVYKNRIVYINENPAIYFKALNTARRSASFENVNKIIYDEAIPDEGKQYLYNEFSKFVNFRETVERLRLDENGRPILKANELVTCVFLGNNSSKFNLWTNKFNIKFNNNNIYKGNDIYYEILKPSEKIKELRENSRFAKIIRDTKDYSYMYDNENIKFDYSKVVGFPPNVKPFFNLRINGYELGVYYTSDFIYISTKTNERDTFNDNPKSSRFYQKENKCKLLNDFLDEDVVRFRDNQSMEIFYDIYKR